MRTYLLPLIVSSILALGGNAFGHEGDQPPGSEPDLTVRLALNQTLYRYNVPAEVITATLSLAVGADDIVTRAGFSTNEELYQLSLVFTDPDGMAVTANQVELIGESNKEGGPPRLFPVVQAGGAVELVPGEAVETLVGSTTHPADPFALTVTLPDARLSYALLKPGWWSVHARIKFRAYDPNYVFLVGSQAVAEIGHQTFGGTLVSNPVRFALVADGDGDGYCFPVQHAALCSNPQPDCNDADATINPGMTEVVNNGVDDDCNPATPDVVPLVNGTVILTANLHTVGSGNHPGSTKAPLADLPVRLFNRAHPCVAQFSMSWHNYPTMYEHCPTAATLIGETVADGTVTFSVTPANYLVIAKYFDAAGNETLYPGVPVGDVGSGQTKTKQIQVIVKSNGKVVPAKTTKKTGSELLIIEPEYVEWDGDTELYPFVFESLGDWSVTTSVTPPEGFVADAASLSEEVNTDLKAVQFTLTDVGSEWVPTGVTHDLTHKGKKEKVKTTVGVKLSKKLAKAKGLTRLGKPVKEKKDKKEKKEK